MRDGQCGSCAYRVKKMNLYKGLRAKTVNLITDWGSRVTADFNVRCYMLKKILTCNNQISELKEWQRKDRCKSSSNPLSSV
jgi:hypothetical protein